LKMKSKLRVTQVTGNGTTGWIVYDLLLVELFDIEYYHLLKCGYITQSLKMKSKLRVTQVTGNGTTGWIVYDLLLVELFDIEYYHLLKCGYITQSLKMVPLESLDTVKWRSSIDHVRLSIGPPL